MRGLSRQQRLERPSGRAPSRSEVVSIRRRDRPERTSCIPNFGSGEWPPGSDSPIGVPWVDVPGSQPPVPISFLYGDESDLGPYPIPPDAPIEGGPDGTGDRHVLVVDRARCLLYETFDTHPDGQSGWTAGSGAIFDLRSNDLRPDGWTSADAAGLPILLRSRAISRRWLRGRFAMPCDSRRREPVGPMSGRRGTSPLARQIRICLPWDSASDSEETSTSPDSRLSNRVILRAPSALRHDARRQWFAVVPFGHSRRALGQRRIARAQGPHRRRLRGRGRLVTHRSIPTRVRPLANPGPGPELLSAGRRGSLPESTGASRSRSNGATSRETRGSPQP